MKIIDTDVHLSAVKFGFSITIDDLIKDMDKNHVDMCITWPMVSYTRQVSEDNWAIAKAKMTYPDRIIPFGGINPMLGFDVSKDELYRCINDYGIKGFKLNGARDGYYINDAKISLPLIEIIAQNKLILATHSGANDPVHSHPYLVREIAQTFPQLKIIMVHMGGAGVPSHGLYDAAIQVAQECQNVYLAPSEADPRAIIKAIRTMNGERICFASDNPFSILKVSLAIFNSLLDDFDQSIREKIMHKNAEELLGLK